MQTLPLFADAVAHVLDEGWFGGVVTKYQFLAVLAAVLVAGLMIPLAWRVSTGEPVRGPLWNALETILLYIRDEVVRPNIHSGHDHDKRDERHDRPAGGEDHPIGAAGNMGMIPNVRNQSLRGCPNVLRSTGMELELL